MLNLSQAEGGPAEKTGEAGRLCYKVYAIHMASQHGALEMVMLDEGPEARYM